MALPKNTVLSDAGGTSSTFGPLLKVEAPCVQYGVWLLAVRNSWRGSKTFEKKTMSPKSASGSRLRGPDGGHADGRHSPDGQLDGASMGGAVVK